MPAPPSRKRVRACQLAKRSSIAAWSKCGKRTVTTSGEYMTRCRGSEVHRCRGEWFSCEPLHLCTSMRINPYLHIAAERIYNPLTDRALTPGDAAFAQLRGFLQGRAQVDESLIDGGWVLGDGEDLSRRH